MKQIGIDTMMTRFTPMLEGVEKFGREVIPLVSGTRLRV